MRAPTASPHGNRYRRPRKRVTSAAVGAERWRDVMQTRGGGWRVGAALLHSQPARPQAAEAPRPRRLGISTSRLAIAVLIGAKLL
jgi:hypothetical protein